MGEDMVEALRRAWRELELEQAEARFARDEAQEHLDSVTERVDVFRDRVKQVSEVTGIDAGEIMRGSDDRDVSSGRTVASTPGVSSAHVAVPAREGSQRWFAAQALHTLGGEASVDDVCSRMVAMGYKHSRTPANDRQLQQSLHALPSQVSWIVPGGVRGHLRLKLA